ncbi:hypothetical protein AQUSIP_14630 [Aquicella siphonis]|uniref:PNPLA domain-containing protein n=1 Tax=Aquicella siphonis TaxID=254247 RepID=A0A5E4PI04_9COXI|nr:patatin-like phospholipase family protein [Aquicella siphonis]VVC76158.1 hypothetical protein AQUSIP_14630 [Aquicella siphonis]
MLSRTNAVINRQTGQIIVQTPLPPINCLALEGGGSRCAAYPGFYKVLYRCGLMHQVQHVAGSSGGAICALAIALGYDPEDAEAIMLGLNMERFLEGSHSWFSSSGLYAKGRLALSILSSTNYSLSSGNEFLRWLESIVEKKLGKKDATFADLAKLAGGNGRGPASKFKYLYITGTNLSLALPECVYFSHETTPNMPLALAVRISASFPFVFEPVLWQGEWYSDGGLIRVLPTKLFDDKRFLPRGYGFTEKGVNPGVLAIKVDSQDEIDQVLWGIFKEVDLKSASEVMAALYNALSQNTDIDEIREARMTIALPDNNIGVLDFSVNQNGKISLISSAERETQNFVENYFNSAYEVLAHTGIRPWLDSLSLEELDDVLAVYESMRSQLPGSSAERIADDERQTPDHHTPTQTQLDEYISYIESYFRYRRLVKRFPDYQFTLKTPDFHINISPLPAERRDWNEHIEKQMIGKLKHVISQIEELESRIESLDHEFIDLPELTDKTPLHDVHFENIQALTTLVEYQRILKEEKKDLEIKLGIFDRRKVIYCKEKSLRYASFIQKINPMLTSNSIPEELKALRFDHYPIFMYESCGYTQRGISMMDLHDETDRQLYIIGALLFLEHKKSKNKTMFVELYREFVSSKHPLPKSLKSLGKILQADGVELFVMAYRLEELLHYFESRDKPKVAPSLCLDVLFAAEKPKKARGSTSQPDQTRDVPMRHLVRVNSIFSNTSDHTASRQSALSSAQGRGEEKVIHDAKSYLNMLSIMAQPHKDERSGGGSCGRNGSGGPSWI